MHTRISITQVESVVERVEVAIHPEDGSLIFRDRIMVYAITRSGARYCRQFLPEQQEAVERMCARARAAGCITLEAGWVEWYPVYGSAEWEDQEPLVVAREKEEAAFETRPEYLRR